MAKLTYDLDLDDTRISITTNDYAALYSLQSPVKGYAIQSISGMVDGDRILGMVGLAGKFNTDKYLGPDNTIIVENSADPYASSRTVRSGIDGNGISFRTALHDYVLYRSGGSQFALVSRGLGVTNGSFSAVNLLNVEATTQLVEVRGPTNLAAGTSLDVYVSSSGVINGIGRAIVQANTPGSSSTSVFFTTTVPFYYLDGASTVIVKNGTADVTGLVTNVAPLGSTAATQHLFGFVSHDASSAAGQVDGLFEGILGRSGDALGLESSTAKLLAGGSVTDVAQALLSSAEYQAEYGASTQSNDDFLNTTYQNALGRAPDNDGRAYWNGQLANGVSRASVAASISTSSDSQTFRASTFTNGLFVPSASDAEVARLYYGLLERTPDAQGLSFWENQHDGLGQSITSLAQSFLTSAEYRTNFGPKSDAQFIGALYRDALGHAPDASGQAYWTGQLAQGASRAGVAVAFLNSQDGIAHLAPGIEIGMKLG